MPWHATAPRPWLDDGDVRLYHGDALEVLAYMPSSSAHCCVTSPPYLDVRPEYPSPTLDGFGAIFGELRRVVIGPALINAGRIFREGREIRWHEPLISAAESAGWAHLDTLVWCKPNANPIRGRVFTDSHEFVYVLGESGVELNVDAIRSPHAEESVARFKRGWINQSGVKGDTGPHKMRQPPNPAGARPRSYVEIHVGREKGNPHPAPMAEKLAEHLVRLGSWSGQTVIDPFAGSGTTALVSRRLGRRSIGIELDGGYLDLASDRLSQGNLLSGLV